MKPISTLPLIAPLAETCRRLLTSIKSYIKPTQTAKPHGNGCSLRKHPVLKNNFTAAYNDILIRTSKSI